MLACQNMEAKIMAVNSVPKPMIKAPKDAINKITHCTICGSDLHMCELQALPTNSDLGILTAYLTPDTGELYSAMQEGDIMGHEAIGIVDDIGLEVETVEKGDRVIILPGIACGACFYCKPQVGVDSQKSLYPKLR